MFCGQILQTATVACSANGTLKCWEAFITKRTEMMGTFTQFDWLVSCGRTDQWRWCDKAAESRDVIMYPRAKDAPWPLVDIYGRVSHNEMRRNSRSWFERRQQLGVKYSLVRYGHNGQPVSWLEPSLLVSVLLHFEAADINSRPLVLYLSFFFVLLQKLRCIKNICVTCK